MKYKWFQVFMEADGAGGSGGTDDGGSNNNAGGADDPNADAAAKPNIFDNVNDDSNNGSQDNNQNNNADNPVVPENYEFKLGEGLSISDTLKERFTKVAKEASLTQEQVNALMDMHSETMLEVLQAGEKQAADWEAECKTQGLLTKEKLGYAVEALNVFGGAEAKQVLIETGAANHPAVMKMLQTIGELIHEDTNKEGENKPQEKNDIDAILFANSKYN